MTPEEEIRRLKAERERLNLQVSQTEEQLKTLQSVVKAIPPFPHLIVPAGLAIAIIALLFWRKK